MQQRVKTTTLLVCTDIFGITAQLQQWLTALPVTVELLSPYPQQQQFADDEAAYQFFTAQGGLAALSAKTNELATEPG